jgi:hypothetical protein
MRWQNLLAAILILAAVSAVRAANITYNIVNYPADQYDEVIPGIDTISGTIITNGTLGAWDDSVYPGPIIGGSVTWQGPAGSYTGTIFPWDVGTSTSTSGIYFTATQIIARPGDALELTAAVPGSPNGLTIFLFYDRISPPWEFHGGEVVDYDGGVMGFAAGGGGISDNWGEEGSIAANDPWIIATAAPGPGIIDWKGGTVSHPTDWNVATNWSPNTMVPNGSGTKASFGNESAANNVADMISKGQTVGRMTFSATTGTTIQSSGGFALTLDNGGSVSTIEVTGTHTISAPVILANDATIIGPGTLSLSGGITGPHNLEVDMNLTATSIQVDALTVGAGSTVTIQAIPGGPLALSDSLRPVPEPSAIAMLILGGASLLSYTWRRPK